MRRVAILYHNDDWGEVQRLIAELRAQSVEARPIAAPESAAQNSVAVLDLGEPLTLLLWSASAAQSADFFEAASMLLARAQMIVLALDKTRLPDSSARADLPTYSAPRNEFGRIDWRRVADVVADRVDDLGSDPRALAPPRREEIPPPRPRNAVAERRRSYQPAPSSHRDDDDAPLPAEHIPVSQRHYEEAPWRTAARERSDRADYREQDHRLNYREQSSSSLGSWILRASAVGALGAIALFAFNNRDMIAPHDAEPHASDSAEREQRATADVPIEPAELADAAPQAEPEAIVTPEPPQADPQQAALQPAPAPAQQVQQQRDRFGPVPVMTQTMESAQRVVFSAPPAPAPAQAPAAAAPSAPHSGTSLQQMAERLRHANSLAPDAARMPAQSAMERAFARYAEAGASAPLPDGRQYQGDTTRAGPNGYGIGGDEEHGVYAGAWRRGKPDGQGVLLYPNGLSYSGRFSDGAPTGEGVFYDSSGKPVEGAALFSSLVRNQSGE